MDRYNSLYILVSKDVSTTKWYTAPVDTYLATMPSYYGIIKVDIYVELRYDSFQDGRYEVNTPTFIFNSTCIVK